MLTVPFCLYIYINRSNPSQTGGFIGIVLLRDPSQSANTDNRFKQKRLSYLKPTEKLNKYLMKSLSQSSTVGKLG